MIFRPLWLKITRRDCKRKNTNREITVHDIKRIDKCECARVPNLMIKSFQLSSIKELIVRNQFNLNSYHREFSFVHFVSYCRVSRSQGFPLFSQILRHWFMFDIYQNKYLLISIIWKQCLYDNKGNGYVKKLIFTSLHLVKIYRVMLLYWSIKNYHFQVFKLLRQEVS